MILYLHWQLPRKIGSVYRPQGRTELIWFFSLKILAWIPGWKDLEL